MKKIIVHTESSLGWGGQEIRVFRELTGLQEMGYHTALIAPAQSIVYARAQAAGIQVYPVSMASKLNMLSFLKIFFLLKKIQPSVVNTHSSEDSWLAGCAARLLKKILVIRTRHVSTPIGSLFSYKYFPDMVFTTSEAISKYLREKGLPKNDIVTIPTGIEFQKYTYSEESRLKIRSLLGLEKNKIVVGNVCVLRSWKGLDFFLETVALLPDNFTFLLVGDGPQRDHLEKKAHTLGIGSKVLFVGHQENVQEYFSAMDILFYTSYASEGVPQSLLQGVGSGLPVAAVRLPSIEETLNGVKNCFWVEYGDPSGAAQMIREKVKPCIDLERKSPPASWRNKHSLKGMLCRLDSIYKKRGF